MNFKLKSITKNFSYTFVANFLSLVVSTILIIIVPKFIGISSYGYWQLYLFFTTYISYMSLGITDGIYLRFGGSHYKDLPKRLLASQFWFIVFFDLMANFLILYLYFINYDDINKLFVVAFTCVTGILVVPRSLVTFVLQATNRIKEFSIILIIEKSLYFIFTITILLLGIKKFEILIYADIGAKLFSTLYAIIICSDMIFQKLENLKTTMREVWINISVGIKLLVANLSSMLIIGIIRISIEKNWSIDTFGKVSLTLSISNMLMLFINSLAIVIFPVMRRTSKDNLIKLYPMLRLGIMTPLLGVLLFFYPMKFILSMWLPQYSDSLSYMALLFPMCLYESKVLLLVNTYLKTLRRENILLKINLLVVITSFILTGITAFLLKNLIVTILLIVFLLALRCIISELYLSKILEIKVLKDIIIELIITIIFIVSSWNLTLLDAYYIYLFTYICYIILKRKELTKLVQDSKNLMNS